MCNICTLFAVLLGASVLLLLPSPVPVAAELRDILKLCDYVNCDASSDPDFREQVVDAAATYKFISAGLPQILWDDVRSGNFFNRSNSLSIDCKQQLSAIADGLRTGESVAYAFLDSSGKSPSGILRSTMTAIGDYDQCLAIDSNGLLGKYCMLDMFSMRHAATAKESSVDLSRVSVFRGFPFWSALCLPSECGEEEVRPPLAHLMRSFGIKVAGDFSCDTRHDISWRHRLSLMTLKQIIAGTFVLGFAGLVCVCTVHHFYNRFLCGRMSEHDVVLPQPEFLKSLSMLQSARNLLFSKPMKYDVMVFEIIKVGVILPGTLGHILMCIELPLSYATMAIHRQLNVYFSSFSTQVLINDNGLLGAALLTGMATFTLLFPVARSGRLPYLAAFVDRVLRFLPAMLSLTALEFLWPILGSGPFYKRVAEFNLSKCSRNWWLNLLFLNNYFVETTDICGGHTFWTSVDLQLFVIGLIGIFIASRSLKAGFMYGLILSILSTLKLMYNAHVYKTTTSIFTANPVSVKIPEYIGHIHMRTEAYVPAYFTGFLLSYLLSETSLLSRLSLMTYVDHVKFFFVTQAAFYFVNINTALVNVFHFLPDSMNPFIIVVNRTIQVIATVLLVLHLLSLKPVYERFMGTSAIVSNGSAGSTDEDKTTSHTKKGKEVEVVSFNGWRALTRLTFPLYISNYLFIRSEFFTRRFLETSEISWMMKRAVSTLLILYVIAFVYQILILSPLDAVRQHLLSNRRNKRVHAKGG